MVLRTLGWNEAWQQAFEPHAATGLVAARILVEHRGRFSVATDTAELSAEVTGRFRKTATLRSDLPAVGDFIALRLPSGDGPGQIEAVLPRRTAFIRKAAGSVTDDQVVAANIDTVFVVDAIDHKFNLRRLERYLSLAHASGAAPVILLSRADLADDATARFEEVAAIAAGASIHVISARTGLGLDRLEPYLQPGSTVCMIGPSGVGKSTLINEILGQALQRTQEVRASDHRGRHTTTGRHLFVRTGGGMLIDTPGMRELQLWYSQEGVEATFEDIEALALQCRFHDCRHGSEPGCAVRAAIECGELDPKRLVSHAKMVDELRRAASVDEVRARRRRKLGLRRTLS